MCFLIISNQNFENRLGHAYGKSLFRLQVCFASCLFIKILLGVCLRKRLDQAQNALFYKKKMWILYRKLLYKMCCCCCDTDYNIIGHLASSERHLFCCIFDKSERKCFAILTEKITVSMEKFMLPRKMLNMIVFCKAQHNA